MYKSVKEILKGKIKADRVLPSCVYFLIREGEIVYVGQACNLNSRLYSHARDGKIFDSYYSIDCDSEDVDLLESFYIHTLRPVENGFTAKTNDMSAPITHIGMYNLLFPKKKCNKRNGVTVNEY